jgi:hypothetical protein
MKQAVSMTQFPGIVAVNRVKKIVPRATGPGLPVFAAISLSLLEAVLVEREPDV